MTITVTTIMPAMIDGDGIPEKVESENADDAITKTMIQAITMNHSLTLLPMAVEEIATKVIMIVARNALSTGKRDATERGKNTKRGVDNTKKGRRQDSYGKIM
mmetsp:Transcript_19383/g.42139  ORF Transcript_19383/g.42139 Transcript_19383/m.42139 type:complete len:103 (+) Transcript_19383:862-1170(+)